MNFTPNNPPREFTVGPKGDIRLSDCGKMVLQPDEQVTFVTERGGEYDVTRKAWGYYATPSLNGRLQRFGLRAVLVRSTGPKYFILLVEAGKEAVFQQYMDAQGMAVVCWLDSDEAFTTLERQLKNVP